MDTSHTVIGAIGLLLFFVAMFLTSREDRKDEMARQHGTFGRVRCATCRKNWRCLSPCEEGAC